MRPTDIADDLRMAVNQPHIPGELLARAAAEIERLRAGYRRIASLSDQAAMERDQARKVATEYL